MTREAERLLVAALNLAEDDRVELVDAFLALVDPSESLPFDSSWLEVIRRRSAELKSGAVVGIPWEQVKRQARESLGG